MAGAQSIRPLHTRPRQLSNLPGLVGQEPWQLSGTEVTGVAAASDEVRSGDIFFALPGSRSHGARFARDAQERGAVCVVTDALGLSHMSEIALPVLVVENPRSHLGVVSSWVYRTDSHLPELFGITGTNGKTTVAFMLEALLERLGFKTALSSTALRRIGSEVFESSLTTPESHETHAFIARMVEEGVRAAVLEVSAHALSRHRVDGIVFDVVGFTNFSHDHLDDYESLDAYFEAKTRLFDPDRAHRGVAIIDSAWGDMLVDRSKIPLTTIAWAGSADSDWAVTVDSRDFNTTGFTLTSRDGRHLSTSVPMVGDFSALNASLAIVMAVEAGHNFELIRHQLENDKGLVVDIPGRTEIVSGPHGPIAYVDYGHTPEAFAQTLRAIRAVVPGKIVMIFGADGDRDTTKRNDMGAQAALTADVVIVTDFHPRTEDPQAIRAALIAGARSAKTPAQILEVPDPGAAVRRAVSMAGEGDAILYAGPGHENYRDLGSRRVSYSARDDMRLALAEAGWRQ